MQQPGLRNGLQLIRVYPRETVIAEKLQTIVKLGLNIGVHPRRTNEIVLRKRRGAVTNDMWAIAERMGMKPPSPTALLPLGSYRKMERGRKEGRRALLTSRSSGVIKRGAARRSRFAKRKVTLMTMPCRASEARIPLFHAVALVLLSIAVALILVSAGPAAAAGPYSVPDFADVATTYGYYDAIMGLREHGSVNGYGDNTFHPEETLARAQFAKMIVVTLGMTDLMGFHVNESMVAPFTDLGVDSPTSLYPHDYIAVAAERKVTQGTGPGTFSPWRKITRAQVVTMVVRAAFEMNPLALEDPPTSFVSPWGSFDPTHGPLMRIAHWNGLLNNVGGPGTEPPVGWDPWAEIGRGETAQILWNLLSKS